jgi:aerobic-type carbon monoxide dehydrogenase small subunit (CoxS/CutS family)
VSGPSGAEVTFTVNGSPKTVTDDPDTPLLHVLRTGLGLAGPRFGCGVGLCGACFVLLDGKPAPACDTPLWSVADKTVVTVEGLADGDELHPVQQAFLDEEAFQCGYCTPGMIVAAVALLGEKAAPSRAEIVKGMQRNICRCGTYPRIVAAVERAAGQRGTDSREVRRD